MAAKGINIIHKSEEDNSVRKIVVGVAVQIGLLEILKALGINPCNTFGCSYGKFANAYAQGIFTMEQAVLAAYYYVGKQVR